VLRQMNDEIGNIVSWFFDKINHPILENYFIKDNNNWDALCSSLHILNDLERPKQIFDQLESLDYLSAIGIMQTMYIEQDSVKTLRDSILESQSTFDLNDYNEIRFLRNEAFGHPSSKSKRGKGNGKSRHFFDIIDSYAQIIKVTNWNKESDIDSATFDISQLVKDNSEITVKYLKEIQQLLKDKFDSKMKEYKVQFSKVFQNDGYIFSKLITKENDFVLIGMFKGLYDEFLSVKEGLTERNVFDEFAVDFNVIDFLFKKVFDVIQTQTHRDIEFYTYSTCLRDKFMDFKKSLQDLDKIFNN
jgi:hypothetical protein